MAGDNDVSMRRSFDALYLTASEIETLGMIVNALGVTGSQLILRHRPELYLHAQANLQKCRGEHEELLKRLDHAARQTKDESALRLIEDLETMPADAMQSLHAARAGACWRRRFSGIASPHTTIRPRAAVAPHEHKRLN